MSNSSRDLEPEDALAIEKRMDGILEKTLWDLEKAIEDLGHWSPSRFSRLSEQIKKAVYI
jgi:hypothetical protein